MMISLGDELRARIDKQKAATCSLVNRERTVVSTDVAYTNRAKNHAGDVIKGYLLLKLLGRNYSGTRVFQAQCIRCKDISIKSLREIRQYKAVCLCQKKGNKE